MLTFFGHHFKDEIPVKLIFKTLSKGIMFDSGFILKVMPKKKVSISGKSTPTCSPKKFKPLFSILQFTDTSQYFTSAPENLYFFLGFKHVCFQNLLEINKGFVNLQ